MAKRKKTRTHKLHTPNVKSTTNPSPKSFVIKSTRGHHGQSSANGLTGGGYNCTSLNLLVKDFRKVMEPNTASNLKERKSNRFKDFLAMAGPLGVTHMIVFSQSLPTKSIKNQTEEEEEIISSINMKIFKLPRGPTLSFKVLRYSLMIDLLNSDKNPRSPGQEFKTEPLLIMNNFNPSTSTSPEETNQLNLLTTTFRNLFPQIKIHDIQLVQTRRIVLLSYNPVTKTIDFRHYLITVKPIGVSKTIRKLMEGALVNQRTHESEKVKGKKKRRVLDLSCVEDVSEYVLGKITANLKSPGSTTSSGAFTGLTSESGAGAEESDYDGISSGGEDESENETHDRKIELPQDYLGKGNFKNSKKAVKLREIGPRLELGLVKIEQGLGNGDVLFHEFIKKTKQEEQAIQKTVKEKEKLRLARKAEQEANVKNKRAALQEKKQAKAEKRKDQKTNEDGTIAGEGEEGEEGEEDEEEDEDEDESEIDEEAEYSDLFNDEDEMENVESQEEDDEEEEEEESDSGAVVESKKKKVKFVRTR